MKTNLFVIGAMLVLLIAAAAGGCASTTPGDPFEGFNRAMFGFNESVDNAVLKPVATGYKAVMPEPARDCVSNVFSNINDVFVGVNSLLQGKVGDEVRARAGAWIETGEARQELRIALLASTACPTREFRLRTKNRPS